MFKTNHVFKNHLRGATLVEILVASIILMIVMTIAYTNWWLLSRHFYFLSAHIEARQEIRRVTNFIAGDVKNSSYLFANRDVTVESINFNLPNVGEKGNAIIMAIPENPEPGSMTYTIVAYYLSSSSSDSANPHTRDLIRYENRGITPLKADIPSTIDLENLKSGAVRNVAKYIDPQGFSVVIGNNGRSSELVIQTSKNVERNTKPIKTNVIFCVNIRN
jgi:hypothetical protein